MVVSGTKAGSGNSDALRRGGGSSITGGSEPRILHRDDRLRGEVLQQGNLLVGEWADLLAVDNDYAQERVVFA